MFFMLREKGRERGILYQKRNRNAKEFHQGLVQKSSIQTASNSHQLSTGIPFQWKQHESRGKHLAFEIIWNRFVSDGLTLKGSLLQGLFCSLVQTVSSL